MRRLTCLLLLLLCWAGSGAGLEAQERTVSGVVTDAADGSPLPQVNIQIKGTQSGTVSDNQGRYQLRVGGPEVTLVFLYTGYAVKEVVVGQQLEINVSLEESHEEIEQVVVTGYQKIEKERSTGSYAILSPKELEKVKVKDISGRLEEVAAGVSYNSATGGLQIRGVTSLKANAAPLVVLDGLPFDGGLEKVNPMTIKTITILRDAAAASIYGARAANGVIVIETIKGNGTFQVQYDGMVQVKPIAKLSGLNLMSSDEYVSFTDWLYRTYGDNLEVTQGTYSDPIARRFVERRNGEIDDNVYNATLDSLRALDNRGQIRSLLERVGVYHSHNITVSGGDKYRFVGTARYEQEFPNDKRARSQDFSLHLRNLSEFNKYVSMDAGLQVQLDYDRTFKGLREADNMYRMYPAYRMLYGPNGDPLQFYIDRDEWSIKNLVALGLQEERLFPAQELQKSYQHNSAITGRSNLALTITPISVLRIEASGVMDYGWGKIKNIDLEDSYTMMRLYNRASENKLNGKHYIPNGGRLRQEFAETLGYTLRLQANYDQEFGIHRITALAGSEIQEKMEKRSSNELLGYNPQSLTYAYVNEVELAGRLLNTAGYRETSFAYNLDKWESEIAERFCSFYATASYSLLRRYNVTGSIRVDQSNLWGTAPGVQWKPLWSVGASWQVNDEAIMQNVRGWLNILVVRASYGISGNVPRGTFPMLVLKPQINSNVPWIPSLQVDDNAPNPQLRWEKTATGNIGVDWAMFDHRFTGSLEWYHRLTSDLLGYRVADPTSGWDSKMENYGRMLNTGVELSMYGQLLSINDFSLSANVIFSYNRSRLLEVRSGNVESAVTRVMHPAEVENYPYASLFSYRFAGISATDGTPEIFLQDGKRANRAMSTEDLTYSGTIVPVFNSSLTLSFGWKGVTLSGSLLYRGGHVMRRPVAAYSSWNMLGGYDRDYLHAWKVPGDELDEATMPSIRKDQVEEERKYTWSAADVHVLKADYIKLNALTLSYSLPQEWVEQIRLSGLEMAFQVENIANIPFNEAGIDPETVMRSAASSIRVRKMPPFYTVSLRLNI